MGALQRQERLSLTAFRFGGCDERHYFDDVWAYHSDTGTWTEILTTGKIPQARWNHATALVDGMMYIFGGSKNAKWKLLDDLAIFDIKSSHWLAHSNTGNGPSPRCSHAMVAASAALVVLAGEFQVDKFDKIWTLDTIKIDHLEEDSTSLGSTLTAAPAYNQNQILRAGPRLSPAFPAQVMTATSQVGNNHPHQHIDRICLKDSSRDSRFSMATEVSRVSDVGCNTQSHARVER